MKKIFLSLILLIFVSSVVAEEQTFKLTGLNNAITKVNNTNALSSIQKNIDKLEAKAINKLNEYDKVEVVDNEIKAKTTGKFLYIFKVVREHKYTLNEDGSITKKNKIFNFLFKDEVI